MLDETRLDAREMESLGDLVPGPEPVLAPGRVVRVCETRLGRNSRLAGIKHLNRLEQVLAGAELREPAVDESLMRSTDDRLVSGTASNLFMVRKGTGWAVIGGTGDGACSVRAGGRCSANGGRTAAKNPRLYRCGRVLRRQKGGRIGRPCMAQ